MQPLDVLVVGDLNPDIVVSGIASSAPRLGTEQFFGAMERTLGGSGALTSVTLARLGLRCALVARVGDDEPAAFCRGILEREGVMPHLLVNPALATGVTIAMAYQSDRMLLTSLGTIADLTADEIGDELLVEARHVHVSSYFMQKRLQPGLAGLLKRARALGLTTSVDTGWDPAEHWLDDNLRAALGETDFLLPNASELAHLTEQAVPERAAEMLLDLGVGAVVFKDGAAGARYFSRAERHTASGFAVAAIDATGAGDAFNAGFIAATLERRSIPDRLRFANACGAVVVQVRGGAGGELTRKDFDDMYGRTDD